MLKKFSSRKFILTALVAVFSSACYFTGKMSFQEFSVFLSPILLAYMGFSTADKILDTQPDVAK